MNSNIVTTPNGPTLGGPASATGLDNRVAADWSPPPLPEQSFFASEEPQKAAGPPDEEFTTTEQAALAKCENLIKKARGGFASMCKAYREIQQRRLYRRHHGSFEAYAKERFDISKAQLYRLIRCAEVLEILSPYGDACPKYEFQIRPMANLESEAIERVWGRAMELAGSSHVTSKVVNKAIRELVKPSHTPHGKKILRVPLETLERSTQQLDTAIKMITQGDGQMVARALEQVSNELKELVSADHQAKEKGTTASADHDHTISHSSIK